MASIDTYTTSTGQTRYRCRVQRKGYKTQTASFSTLKEARRWGTMVEGDIIAGRHLPQKSKHTLAELLDRYSRDIMPRKTAETQRSQKYVIAYWKRTLGHMLLEDIQPSHVIAARNTIAQKGKPATVAKYLVTLSHAFTTAIKEYQWLDQNPCSRVSRPPQPPGRVRFLSDQERTRLLQECRASHNRYLYPLVTMALYTGLRRGSLFALTTKNTDVEQGLLTLERTKNGSRLILPLVGEALTIARELICTSKDGYLFPRGKGAPWNHYRHAWEYALARAEIEDCTYHDLRHCVGSYLVQCGIDLYTVSQILGHKTLAMSARYAHLQTDNLRQALETMTSRLF
jgi:integrase